MGYRGPLSKDQRQRGRDSQHREALVPDDVVRGPDLPTGVLEEEWHPMVTRWWEAFRRSPMAQRVTDDVQWETLLAAVVLYNDAWTSGVRGRVTRIAEFRIFLSSYFVTPGDLRRNGLEVVVPTDDVDDSGDVPSEDDGASVTSIAARRERLADS